MEKPAMSEDRQAAPAQATPNVEPPGRRFMLFAFRAARSCLVAYLLVILMLRVFENNLVYPAPSASVRWREPNWLGHEDVHFTSTDGTQLHGWFVAPDQPRGYLLYCHGNGENVADQAELMAVLRDRHGLAVFAFDYRGYGKSEGSPDETGVLADGSAAYVWLANRSKLNAASKPPLIMGRSLGGGVAVDVAVNHPTRGLILENTFSSLPDAAARLYWWAPVRWLMRNRFDSLAKIPRYQEPLLQTHGARDELIPVDLAHRLFAAAGSEDKEFVEIAGGSHNGGRTLEFDRRLIAFIERLIDSPQQQPIP